MLMMMCMNIRSRRRGAHGSSYRNFKPPRRKRVRDIKIGRCIRFAPRKLGFARESCEMRRK